MPRAKRNRTEKRKGHDRWLKVAHAALLAIPLAFIPSVALVLTASHDPICPRVVAVEHVKVIDHDLEVGSSPGARTVVIELPPGCRETAGVVKMAADAVHEGDEKTVPSNPPVRVAPAGPTTTISVPTRSTP